MPPELQQLTIWTDQQARSRQTATSGVVRFLIALWRGLGGGQLYNDRLVKQAAAASVAQVRSGQEAVAYSTQEYLRRSFASMQAEFTPRPLELPRAFRPVEPEIQWERPAEQYRYARSTGLSEDEAIDRAIRRVEQMADDDLALASRLASEQSLAELDEEPLGFRRIIHPELSTTGVCGLCIAASDRLYLNGEHKEFHTHCRCEVLPVLRGNDPGKLLNNNDLGALYEAAGGRDRDSLKAVRYETQEHGELGAVLRRRGDSFLDAEGAAERATRPAA